MDGRLNVSYFQHANISIGDKNKATIYNIVNVLQGKYYNFNKYNNVIDFSNKLWVPAIQNTNCGMRVQTQDKDYFSKYWNGFIFVDIDHLEDDPDAFLDKLHNKLCKYYFYLSSQTSYSKNGFHLIFYIPKKYGTVEEYYRYAAYIYTILFKDLIPIENYDWHNFQHHQVLKIAPHQWKINNEFKIKEVNIKNDDISPFFQSQAQHFIELNKNEVNLNTDRKRIDSERYVYSFVDDSNIKEKFFYFDHTDRWKLFMTLMYIYNEDKQRVFDAACKIMKYSETQRHSYNELCLFFDPVRTHMDWYRKFDEHAKKHPEALTSKIGFLEKYFGITLNDKYDTKIKMQNDEYLLDYKDLILNSLQPGINFLKVNTGGGKTTFWDVVRPNAIIIEPFGSIINDKYDEEVHKAAGPGKKIDINEKYQVSNYWRFIDFVNYENKFYEYIVIDESHLVGMQGYRNRQNNGHSMIDFLNALNVYTIQYPETKIILQTATPSNEFYFFNIKNKLTFNKNLLANVNINYDYIQFLNDKDEYVDNIYASISHLVNKMHNEGRKVMIYWGSGGVSVMKAIQKTIKTLKGLKCAIYHKRNEKSYDMDYIHEEKKIGKFDVLICSCYFSVGCDLNDEEDAGIIIVGNNPVQEDAQCVGRFRISKDIDVHILTDKISGIRKVDVSKTLLRMQKKIRIENEICDLRNNTILTPMCDMDDIDKFSYMECSRDYFCDLERKFEIYKELGYNINNIISKEWDENSKCFFYDICENVDGIDMPCITLVDEGLQDIKDEIKRYYKTNEEVMLDLYSKFCNGERNFKEIKSSLNDRPKVQDWVKIIEIFSKHYDLNYMLQNFTEESMMSITHEKLKELLKWKMKLNKGKYDKIEKLLIDNLIYNYDNSKEAKKDIQVWMLLYYCIWISQSEERIDHRYDTDSKRIFFIWDQWYKRISSILFVNADIRNYILNYGINDEEVIFSTIPDFLKDIYTKPDIDEAIKTYMNNQIYKNDIKKFLNIKLATLNKDLCSSLKLETNIKSLVRKINVKGCMVTNKFNKKKLEKYNLFVGKVFEDEKSMIEWCKCTRMTLNNWKSKSWIKSTT